MGGVKVTVPHTTDSIIPALAVMAPRRHQFVGSVWIKDTLAELDSLMQNDVTQVR